MRFSFIHTGDLHLDSPLRGLAALEEDAKVRRVTGAARAAFEDVVEEAIRRNVDAVLIAGDLWDGDWPDLSAGLFVQAQAARLKAAGIGVFAILGNHDAQSRVTDRIRSLDALHLFSADRPASVECGDAVIHGQSYARADTTENLAVAYPAAWPGRINVGLLHTALAGASAGHAPYAPCTLAELSAKGYDYWALGHVHTRALIQDRPAGQGGTVAYCGVLQGRHARELGSKGVWHGVIEDGRTTLTPIDLGHVAWLLAEADVSEEAPEVALRRAIETTWQARPAAEMVVMRVALHGSTGRHAALQGDVQRLREEALAVAAGLDAERLMIEDVKLRTEPAADATPPRLPQHFAEILARTAGRPEAVEAAGERVREILNVLPGPVKAEMLDANPAIAAFAETGDGAALLAEFAPQAAARVDRFLSGGTDD